MLQMIIVTCPSVNPPSYKLGIPFSKTTSFGNSSIPYSAASFWGRFLRHKYCILSLFKISYRWIPGIIQIKTSSSNLTKTIPCSSRSSSISSKTSRAAVEAGCSSCKGFKLFFFLIYFLYCVDQFTGSWFVGSVWLIFPSEDCFIFPDSLWWRWWLFCPIDDLSEDPRDQFSAPIAQAKDKQPILV